MPVPSSCFTPGRTSSSAVAGARAESVDGQPSRLQPPVQRVGAEVLLHDEHGARRSGASRPSQVPSSVVQGGLADADRRVRPHVVDDRGRRAPRRARRPARWRARAARRWPGTGRAPARSRRPPTRSRRAPARRQRAGDRAVAAAEVDEGAGRAAGAGPSSRRCLVPGVDPVGGEHAAVGGERERQVGQVEPDLLRRRPARRARLEVVPRESFEAGSAIVGNLPVA